MEHEARQIIKRIMYAAEYQPGTDLYDVIRQLCVLVAPSHPDPDYAHRLIVTVGTVILQELGVEGADGN